MICLFISYHFKKNRILEIYNRKILFVSKMQFKQNFWIHLAWRPIADRFEIILITNSVSDCLPLKEPYWRENNFPAKIFQMIIIQSLLKFLKSKLLLLFWFVFISIIHHPCATKIRNNEIEIPEVGPGASLNARYRIAPLNQHYRLGLFLPFGGVTSN